MRAVMLTLWILLFVIYAAVFLMLLGLTGCAAVPLAAGYFTSGGVTLYKSAKESGPKAEFVLVKVEANHIVYESPHEETKK